MKELKLDHIGTGHKNEEDRNNADLKKKKKSANNGAP